MASFHHQQPGSSTHPAESEVDEEMRDAADILVGFGMADQAQFVPPEAGATLIQTGEVDHPWGERSHLLRDDFQKALREINAPSTAESRRTVEKRILQAEKELKEWEENDRKDAEYKRCGILSADNQRIIDHEGWEIPQTDDPDDYDHSRAQDALKKYRFQPSECGEDDPLRLVHSAKTGKNGKSRSTFKVMKESEMSEDQKKTLRRDLLGPSPTIIETPFGEMPNRGLSREEVPWDVIHKYIQETEEGREGAEAVQDLVRYALRTPPESDSMSLKDKMYWLQETIVNAQELEPNVITPWFDKELPFSKACKNPGKAIKKALEQDLEAMLRPNSATMRKASVISSASTIVDSNSASTIVNSSSASTIDMPAVFDLQIQNEQELDIVWAPITNRMAAPTDATTSIVSTPKRKATKDPVPKPTKKAKTVAEAPAIHRPRAKRTGKTVADPWDLASEIALLEMQAAPGFSKSQNFMEQEFARRMPAGAASRTYNALRFRLKLLNDASFTADDLRREGRPYSEIVEEARKAARRPNIGMMDAQDDEDDEEY